MRVIAYILHTFLRSRSVHSDQKGTQVSNLGVFFCYICRTKIGDDKMTYPMTKTEALAGFSLHCQTAKNASQLAMGGETAVDMMLDDLAKALDVLYETDEFTALALG